ncbi:hypothetical protein OKA04_07470 [Luteolibacter flavescens]|uniref:Uncharacterized protein n=1 Tax=Luteolibacter flavescens TaxID=1859460 RepID=A0ABT3FLX0_9BACT|nr:hypothetical protein [Luteolibacter flavescens]MCW1884567.1 hypothetical protein [Luteolibacter flavescens]
MSTQERITELAIAALRSAPKAVTPRPATFMLPFEKPQSVAIANGVNDARFEKSAGAAYQTNWPFARQEVWI